MKFYLSLLLLVAVTSLAQAQERPIDPFIRENNAKRTQNPDGLSFTIRFKDNRKQFRQGETITLELSFATSKPNTFSFDAATYDRSGRLEVDDFILDREDAVADPLDDYFNSGLHGFVGGGLRAIPELTDQPYIITAELNEWMRFDKPGQYRVYVVSNRIGKKATPNDPTAVVSNVVDFEILPADKKWATQRLNEATTALSKPDGDHRSACRTLRYLGTMAAVSEMRKRFRGDDDNCEWEYKFGLIGSPHRDFAIREMQNAINSPEQPVTSDFLTTLALLEFTRQATPLPPYPNGTDEQNSQWQTQLKQRQSAYDKLRLNYLRQLVMAIPQKQPPARATSLQTLLDYQAELNVSDFSEWSTLLASMPDVFSRLPLDDQVRLLTYQWKPIASAGMLPVLRAVLKANNNDNVDRRAELRSIALRRLYELSPVEGRGLILDEIRSPKPRVNQKVLRSLPDKTLPELDHILAANLQESRRPNGNGDVEAISELIERYATAEILPQVRAVYESPGAGKWACHIQASLLAYLLRTDPSTGGEQLNKALAARGENLSRCYASTLVDVARLHMTAEVEEAAIAALDDEDVEVVSQAANILGEYGSAAAEEALWRRLEKWHEEMQSRSEEIRKQNPGLPPYGGTELNAQALIEQTLRFALMNGRAWLLDPEKLKRLRDLCLTDGGRREVDGIIDGWNQNIYVSLNTSEDEWSSFSVAHYQFKSLDALKKKLLQFPKGTLFKWTAPARSGDAEVFQQLKTHLEEHGMKLEREPEQ